MNFLTVAPNKAVAATTYCQAVRGSDGYRSTFLASHCVYNCWLEPIMGCFASFLLCFRF